MIRDAVIVCMAWRGGRHGHNCPNHRHGAAGGLPTLLNLHVGRALRLVHDHLGLVAGIVGLQRLPAVLHDDVWLRAGHADLRGGRLDDLHLRLGLADLHLRMRDRHVHLRRRHADRDGRLRHHLPSQSALADAP